MLTKKRVLVVEDQPLIALNLVEGLEEAGAEVLGPAMSVSQGLVFAREHGIDAAVLDINLPDGLVTPVADVLTERGVAVLFCTGVEVPASLKLQYPNLPVVLKPASPQALAKKLAAMLS
jgi:DNA-binding response OmpR family regulator